MILEARGITVRYSGGARPALDAVDFAVGAGAFVAVVGPNGCGKTSLTRALLGAVALERGEVRLDGRPLGAWEQREIARTIGVVAQREETPFPIRVADLVMMGRYPHLGPLAPPGIRDAAAVRGALERCDVWDLRDRMVESLSGGEWQRVRVARALAQEPRLLILDEPSAALDVRHEMELFELVHDLVAEGLGAVVVSHHLNIAARFAEELFLLREGRVAARGTPSEVLRQEIVTEVFAWPVAVTTWRDGRPQIVPLRRGEESGR
ncbi:MAG: ABC transporter ATP-binding protein [Gemmatimonadales bacterium]